MVCGGAWGTGAVGVFSRFCTLLVLTAHSAPLNQAGSRAFLPSTAQRSSAAASDAANSTYYGGLSGFTQAEVTAANAAENDQTELYRIELPARVDTGGTIRFTLPDGRLARTTVPDVTQIPGWPEQRFIHVRVPKGGPRPPGLPPRPRQPSTILEGVFEAAQQADSAVAAQIAAHAVELSPSKVKEKDELRRKRPLPPLNPELHKAAGASATVLAATEGEDESD